MCVAAVFSVSTRLAQDRVWELFSNINNWSRCSEVYFDLQWAGPPWVRSSCITGYLRVPIILDFRYVVEECNPPHLLRYIAHSKESGFATERTIRLQANNKGGTLIHVQAYAVGEPVVALPGTLADFLRASSGRFFADFARFCDAQVAELASSPSGQQLGA